MGLKGIIGGLVGKPASITSAREISAHFRRLTISGETVKGAEWQLGDKVEIVLPSGDVRTYTPFNFDRGKGSFELLLYVHGNQPGANWAKAAQVGESVKLMNGIRRSIPLAEVKGPVVLFGDESGFALASTLDKKKKLGAAVFEVQNIDESEIALDDMELKERRMIERSRGDRHLAEIEIRLREVLGTVKNATLVLTGKAQSIQRVKASMEAESPAHGGPLVRAYWSLGKSGLD